MALLEKGNFPQTTVNGKSVSGIDHVLIYFCSAVTVTLFSSPFFCNSNFSITADKFEYGLTFLTLTDKFLVLDLHLQGLF
ncbi:MAG: hypothetical protein ACLFTJ_04090 [Halothece sp.]